MSRLSPPSFFFPPPLFLFFPPLTVSRRLQYFFSISPPLLSLKRNIWRSIRRFFMVIQSTNIGHLPLSYNITNQNFWPPPSRVSWEASYGSWPMKFAAILTFFLSRTVTRTSWLPSGNNALSRQSPLQRLRSKQNTHQHKAGLAASTQEFVFRRIPLIARPPNTIVDKSTL